ncbi:MAG: sensor domain-containing diguanylate cyclase [Beijerinckiaceae bacterium]|jgi:diguanylate cyclase (GGDEF)-like protein
MMLGRLGGLFTTILVLSLLSIWVLFAGILYESYQNEWRSASLFAGNVDSLLEQAISRDVELYDLSLKSTVEGYADQHAEKLPPNLRQRVLFDQSTNATGLGSILILDKDGTAVADSRFETPRSFNGANMDYFKIHRDGQFERELFISHPFKSLLQQNMWTIGLSRRIDDAEGNFDGIVLGTLKLSYFTHLFGAVDLPAGSSIEIIHDDGMVLMSSPYANIGQSLRASGVFRQISQAHAGEVTGVSDSDRVERLYAFKRVGRLPMTLAVGIPTNHFLSMWRWRVSVIALGFFILSGLIVILAITLGRELQRRTLAERRLSELASTDGLTGLANRRHFDETLELEWRRALRDQAPAALLMIDCDYFKKFNDTYGHLEGDQVLRAVAGALRDSVQRPADLVARYGGEEFAILLPDTGIDGTLRVAEAVRAAVARLDWQHAGSPLGRLTVSVGAASCLPGDDGGAVSLIKAADFALYHAKKGGRDQVAVPAPVDMPGFDWREDSAIRQAS